MKILFAVDLAEPEEVTDAVNALAQRLEAELYVLHVSPPQAAPPFAAVDPLTGLGGFDPYALYDPALEETLEQAEASAFQQYLAERFPLPVRPALRKGIPADVILEDAERLEVTLIVIGKRHHSRIEQFLLGSVTSEVVKHATLPTLLIPIPEAAR
jgi:universal stress protein F